LHIQEELGKYSPKLSIISKQSKLMQKELRYQVKTQAISDMPKKFPAISQLFYIYIYIYKCYMEMTSYNMQGMIKLVQAR
jgi:hypothetical protein